MCKNVHNYLHNVLEVLAFCIVGELPLLFPGAILVIYPSKFAFGAEPDATADQTVPSMRKSLSVRVMRVWDGGDQKVALLFYIRPAV